MQMRFGVIWAVMFAAALTSARGVFADGKVFSHAGPAEIPDQSALIVFDGKIETLAIETRFIAKGKDFAWVVPLPAKPEIRAGTSGMFPTLRGMFLPRMWEFEGAGFVMSVGVLLCFGLALGMLGVGDVGIKVIVWGLVIVILGMLVLVPLLGKARGGGPGGSAVSVLERAVIGDFDVAVVQSQDAGEMKEWLTTNGFQSSAQADRAIENYVKNGWVFVVSKLTRAFDDARMSAPTPLIFRFPAKSPVYPMQLTGAGATTPLKLELFVFGDSFALAPSFKSVRRSEVRISDNDSPFSWRGTTDVRVSHAVLKDLVGGATCATLLRRVLVPAEMDRDIEIRMTEGSKTGNQVCSPMAAIQLGIVSGLFGFLILGSVMGVRAARKGPWPAGFRAIGIAIVAGCVVGLTTWSMLPQAPVGDSHRVELRRRAKILNACYEVVFLQDKKPGKNMSAEEISKEALRLLREEDAQSDIRVEDSPGNFVVREADGGFECVFYGWDGQEIVQLLN